MKTSVRSSGITARRLVAQCLQGRERREGCVNLMGGGRGRGGGRARGRRRGLEQDHARLYIEIPSLLSYLPSIPFPSLSSLPFTSLPSLSFLSPFSSFRSLPSSHAEQDWNKIMHDCMLKFPYSFLTFPPFPSLSSLPYCRSLSPNNYAHWLQRRGRGRGRG